MFCEFIRLGFKGDNTIFTGINGKLDADKVLAAVRKNLYNEVYSDQQTGLRQGLIDGGIKRADGSKVKISELNKILKYCKDTGQGTLENWLKSNGFIAKGK